ncbi:hypothetical protein H5410_002202, partial [Solanum commersonii]
RAKSLPASSFLRSPESLNPNELIVYSRRKRLNDQTTQLQSSPKRKGEKFTFHFMMQFKLVSWNVRGLNNRDKRRVIKNIMGD